MNVIARLEFELAYYDSEVYRFKHSTLFLHMQSKFDSIRTRIGQVIIIKSRWQHGFPWLALSIRPYHPSFPEDLSDYILCPYKSVVSKVLLVGQHWHVHLKGSIEERHLWSRPCCSSNVPQVKLYDYEILSIFQKHPVFYEHQGSYHNSYVIRLNIPSKLK